MALVPGRGVTPQVDVGAAPAGRFEAPQFVNYDAQLTAQTGQNLQQASNQIGQIATDMAERANAARLDDAANQAQNAALDLKFNKESGFLNIKGEAALNRKDAPPLDEDYTAQLKTKTDAIYDGLSNQAQRDAFKHFSGNLLTQFRGSVMEHMNQQNTVYMGSVAQATQDTAAREIALSWGDPKGIEGAAERLRSAAYQEAQLSGKSAEWAETKARDGLSRGHTLALTAAIERGDYGGASAYLDKYAGQMQADDILRSRNAIDKQDSQAIVTGAVDKAYALNGASFAGSDTNRALNVLWGAESNFRQFDKTGNVIASGKGARGMSQVLPSTAPEAAKLAGLPWNEELFYRKMTGDPVKDQEAIDYNKALGAAYFQKQVRDFGGKLDVAYAAYNAGPGATRTAIKTAEKEGGSFLDYLPKETQNYVKNNVAAYNAGKGGAVPTQKQMDDAVLSSLGANATEAQKQDALAQSRVRYSQLSANVKEQGFQSINSAITALQQNGGNFDALPVLLRESLPLTSIDQVKSYASKIQSGTFKTNTVTYDAMSDSQHLVKMTDGEFNASRMQLEDKDFRQFAAERQALKSGKALNAAGDVPRDSINVALGNKLQDMGINANPPTRDTAAKMRVGAIKQFVTNAVLEEQAGLGRKLRDDEVGKLVDRLFLRSFKFRSTVFNKEYGDVKSMPVLGMDYGDIPAADRDEIKANLVRSGVEKPTNGQILRIYFNGKARNENG